MSAVLQFDSERAKSRRQPGDGAHTAETPAAMGEVIIFPGVRVEHAGIDLSHRLVRVSSAGEGASGSPAGKP
jgi:hypothetical protein